MKRAFKTFIYTILLLVTITVKAQVQLNCCHINQTIPVFKADSDFSFSKAYSILISKERIAPINQSDSPLEVRVLRSSDLSFDMVVISCLTDHFAVTRYRTAVREAGVAMTDEESRYYAGYQDIGPEPGSKLTNLVMTEDLATFDSTFWWGSFFKILTDNHLFDMPHGEDFIQSVIKKTHPDNYPDGNDMPVTIIQIKAGNKYRNMRFYGGIYRDKATLNLDIVEQQKAILDVFATMLDN